MLYLPTDIEYKDNDMATLGGVSPFPKEGSPHEPTTTKSPAPISMKDMSDDELHSHIVNAKTAENSIKMIIKKRLTNSSLHYILEIKMLKTKQDKNLMKHTTNCIMVRFV